MQQGDQSCGTSGSEKGYLHSQDTGSKPQTEKPNKSKQGDPLICQPQLGSSISGVKHIGRSLIHEQEIPNGLPHGLQHGIHLEVKGKVRKSNLKRDLVERFSRQVKILELGFGHQGEFLIP